MENKKYFTNFFSIDIFLHIVRSSFIVQALKDLRSILSLQRPKNGGTQTRRKDAFLQGSTEFLWTYEHLWSRNGYYELRLFRLQRLF